MIRRASRRLGATRSLDVTPASGRGDPLVMAARWGALGREVRRRRRELGFRTLDDFARAARIGARTLGTLERGEAPVSEETLSVVELALRWEPGSCAAILSGGRATPSHDAEVRPIVESWSSLDDRARRVILAVWEALRRQ